MRAEQLLLFLRWGQISGKNWKTESELQLMHVVDVETPFLRLPPPGIAVQARVSGSLPTTSAGVRD